MTLCIVYNAYYSIIDVSSICFNSIAQKKKGCIVQSHKDNDKSLLFYV